MSYPRPKSGAACVTPVLASGPVRQMLPITRSKYALVTNDAFARGHQTQEMKVYGWVSRASSETLETLTLCTATHLASTPQIATLDPP